MEVPAMTPDPSDESGGREDWPECDRHGKYNPGEHMCPDCFDNAKAMGATPLGGTNDRI